MSSILKLRINAIVVILLFSGIFLVGCKKSENNIPKETLAINEWILDYMDFFYFWNKELPNIDPRLEPDSEKYFEKLLKKPDDKWSFITDNAKELFEYFDGVIKSMGYSIQLYYLEEGSDQVIAIVEFVYPNSPASEAGIARGDIFTRINGSIITDSNYQELLSLDKMTITLASLTNSGIVEQPSTINLNAIKLETNPIVVKSIAEVNGTKIGYLAYTSFIEKYDSELIQTFLEFKEAGVNELVLDLRYNGGGSVTSAQLLASLIAPTSAGGDIFISEVWNNNITEYYQQEDIDTQIRIEHHDAALHLNRVYVLTTQGTASASEMVIYGLKPYMEVVQIGDVTYGKYYGSITITADEDEKHNWAIQPIVMRSENKTNSINYSVGLPPDYELIDNRYNAQLGDPEEHFLAAAIGLITKGSLPVAPTLKSKSVQRTVRNSKDLNDPLRTIMITKMKK
ncbi:MAG TPA: S41 family peptidase [Marinilabiliaceae bacterium]|nr:S41 family peptidase [Marinilabiliaceae bacterium]